LYIFNGIPDWLYEEDVLSDRVAHYWSPNDQYICYASFNDTDVPLQPWPWYGSKSNVYVRTIQIAYPKAGNVTGNTPGPNTKVQLHIFDVLKKVSKPLSPPSNFSDIDHYYLQVVWRNDSTVMVTWANRVQNISIISVYDADATNPQSVTNLQLTVSGGWVEVPPAMPLFVESGQKYLTILPQQLTSGPWRHLALVTAPDTGNGAVTYLMNKEEEVMEIVGYDPIKNYVYFTSTNGEPTELHIKRVNVSGGPAQIPYCLTCEMPPECRYMTASFSPSGIYYFLNCHGPDIPTYTLRKTGDGSLVKVMENNDALRAALALKALPTREFLTFPVGDGYTGRAEIFFPPNYNSSQKYKLLVYAYAGPGSQRVMKTFPVGGSTTNWLLYLKSTHNIIVASLDGRGSMAAGDKLKFEMYRKLSTVEVQDQIIGGNYFRGLSYIDKSVPSAIFGWSYGGGVAAHVMGDPSRTFTCGISVAPVTTKAYYDTAYTERYLGLATKNDDELGYNNTDVMNKVANFHNKTFMIAQGSADDNVHYMHSAHLITALANAGVQFRQNMYADQNHNINSPGLSRHLYASMTNFLLNDCWPTQTTSNNPPSVTTGAGTGRPNNLLIIVLSLCLALLSVVKRNIAN
jgi:dipeptidyl-peptidase-4